MFASCLIFVARSRCHCYLPSRYCYFSLCSRAYPAVLLPRWLIPRCLLDKTGILFLMLLERSPPYSPIPVLQRLSPSWNSYASGGGPFVPVSLFSFPLTLSFFYQPAIISCVRVRYPFDISPAPPKYVKFTQQTVSCYSVSKLSYALILAMIWDSTLFYFETAAGRVLLAIRTAYAA